MDISLNMDHLKGFVEKKDFERILPNVEKAHYAIEHREGKGSEFTGWVDLPGRIEDSFLDELEVLGEEIRDQSDCLISIGIGGSYMGIRASIEFLVADQKLPIHFAGHNLSSGYLHFLLEGLKDKRLSVVVISKSGTTTEPALAFRFVKKFMKEKYAPAELKKRIICITNPSGGALRKIAENDGYRTYPIYNDVGGRFSILTPAGLVPLAITGMDIRSLIKGARVGQDLFSQMDMDKNIAYQYAASRYLLNQMGKEIEVMSTFYQRLSYLAEWWKQLFGESEGKDGKGIYPSSLNYTTDLHSMGQLMQEGIRNMFETFVIVEKPGIKMLIPREEQDLDNFNYVSGQDLDFVNQQAYRATSIAHFEGGVPNMTINVPQCEAYTLGQLYYFFEKAVAITGYLLGVNPFNQPGVEAYKRKMFELLGGS